MICLFIRHANLKWPLVWTNAEWDLPFVSEVICPKRIYCRYECEGCVGNARSFDMWNILWLSCYLLQKIIDKAVTISLEQTEVVGERKGRRGVKKIYLWAIALFWGYDHVHVINTYPTDRNFSLEFKFVILVMANLLNLNSANY